MARSNTGKIINNPRARTRNKIVKSQILEPQILERQILERMILGAGTSDFGIWERHILGFWTDIIPN